MAEALFCFDDSAAARQAAEQVARSLPPRSVTLHARHLGADERLRRKVDEAVSGGLLSNLYDLVDGLMDWGNTPPDAGDYEQTISSGGAVVRVRADSEQAEGLVDDVMAGFVVGRRSSWR